MQEGDPSFATHEVQDNRPGSRLLLSDTPVEVPDKCTRVAFLTHLLGNLTLHIFCGGSPEFHSAVSIGPVVDSKESRLLRRFVLLLA